MIRDLRMIEHEIPLAAVSYHASKEKKHPRRFAELIHPWPARRPRSACRVATAAALMRVPDTEEGARERLDLLDDLTPYECAPAALVKARRILRDDHGGRAPRILDLFAGGGAIPLEAANLGCEAHAVELNPVAHIIALATCVYPQRYGAKLADLVETWGNEILRGVSREIGDLYPPIVAEAQGSAVPPLAVAAPLLPIAYLWTRTVPCADASCGATVPLARQTWLCRRDKRYIALKVVPERTTKRVRFDLVHSTRESDLGFDPADLSSRGDTECPFCGAVSGVARAKALGTSGRLGMQLMAIVGTAPGERGRVYLPAEAARLPSDEELRRRLEAFGEQWPGPARLRLPEDARNFWAHLYGLDTYDKLFSPRQAVALLTFAGAIREARARIAQQVGDADLVKAIMTYLALALDRTVNSSTMICRWKATDQIVIEALSRQALPMVWDVAEGNPLAHVSGSFPMAICAEVEAIRGLGTVPSASRCVRASAAELPFPDETFDAIITDPPYYDNISYADLSDFYFVWLKRTLSESYPEHLAADQAPKKHEATVTPHRHQGRDHAARAHFERMLTRAFAEAGRVVRPGGPVVVVYAHKTVAGWATLVDALRAARCAVTEAWPLRTESDARLNARGTAALATSIFLVARKRSSDAACEDYDGEIVPETAKVIDERIATLWELGLTGADLVIAVIGASLGAFCRFAEVRRANGAGVATGEFLEDAQRMTIEALLHRVVRDAAGKDVSVGGIDPVSRLYVVARLQLGEAAAEYDLLKNLAIGALPRGTELEGLRGALMDGKRALLSRQGSKVRLRGYDERGDDADLGLPVAGRVPALVDVLHRLLWLQKHRAGETGDFLRRSGADVGAVRLLAQALGGEPLRAEPVPGAQADHRTTEQRAIDTLLASFPDIVRTAR